MLGIVILNPTSRYIPEETLSLHDFSEIVPRTEIDNNTKYMTKI